MPRHHLLLVVAIAAFAVAFYGYRMCIERAADGKAAERIAVFAATA
jgi:hypothetical protein